MSSQDSLSDEEVHRLEDAPKDVGIDITNLIRKPLLKWLKNAVDQDELELTPQPKFFDYDALK